VIVYNGRIVGVCDDKFIFQFAPRRHVAPGDELINLSTEVAP